MLRRGTAIIDPPWPYAATGKHAKLAGYSTDKEYPALTLDALHKLPIKRMARYVFLWTTVAFTEVGFGLVRKWGFEPVTMLFWVKTQDLKLNGQRFEYVPSYGVGYWFRGAVEPIIVAKDPKAASIRTQNIGLLAPNAKHSRKPLCLHGLIEDKFPGPYLELFARPAPGMIMDRSRWILMGNEMPGRRDIRAAISKYLGHRARFELDA